MPNANLPADPVAYSTVLESHQWLFREKQRLEAVAIYEPSMELSPDSARSLMQALWDAGVRPEDANLSSPAEVTALKNHIRFAEGVTGALLGRSPTTSTPESP